MTGTIDVAMDRDDLAGTVRDLLAGRDGWQLRPRGPWWLALPPEYQPREQGWKLHVSASVADAVAVLRAATQVLTGDACAFKFAATVRTVRLIDGRGCDRSSAGKFLTAYPDDDDHFRRLAERLDAATQGLTGPVILSDRAYRPDSLVHYRFGGFHNRTVLDNDGVYRQILTAPDGSLMEDRREARFAPPDWAGSPLPDPRSSAPPGAGSPRGTDGTGGTRTTPDSPTNEASARSGARAVLLGGRFLVREAIRHSTKGGVFLAEDILAPDSPATDSQDSDSRTSDSRAGRVDSPSPGGIVVKQARPYTECDSFGHDSRDLLRNEARMLDLLAPHGLAPARIATFEQNGQLFLAEHRVVGDPLRSWVAARTGDKPAPPRDEAVRMAARLVSLVDAVHQIGIVLRDLSATNVVVTPDGQPVLVDLELAAPAGELARRGGTPGYQAPEQAGSDAERTLATPAEDLFSLGALLFLLATGNDPILPEDSTPARPTGQRLGRWLDLVAAHTPTARVLARAVGGLCQQEPSDRWSLDLVRRGLRRGLARVSRSSVVPGSRLPGGRGEGLLGDGLDHLLATMTPDDPSRLWPTGDVGARTDPCNVQHGAAGVLSVLTRIGQTPDRDLLDVRPAVRVAAEWIVRALPGAAPDRSPVLPGLYFGRAGVAWALFDAARLLDRPDLAATAVDLALRLPVDWPNADVTHGMAGAGLAHLHLAARTGDPRLAHRAGRYAASLVERARRDETGVSWPVPASFDSRLAGLVHYGFAHGVAGIGAFLLAAARASGDDRALALAREAGLTLCEAVRTDGQAAWWPEAPGGSVRYAHWCSGSSGVGTFLLRLYRDTGEQRFAELAGAAAHAVHRARWHSLPATCHGLAGDGEFLLDAAGTLAEPRYLDWAGDLADLLYARHAVVDGRAVVPDETGRAVVADYNTGLAGAVAFLFRLRHGGPRLWMVDR